MTDAEGPDFDRLLSTAEVAEKLHISKRKVLRLVHTDTIPVVGVFGVQDSYVYRAEDIAAVAEKLPRPGVQDT